MSVPERVPRWRTLLVLAFVLAAWAAIGFVTLSPRTVYSGDLGLKYVQARSLIRAHFTSMVLEYPGAWIDPDREFFPFRSPFVVNTPSGVQGIYPPAGALLQAPLVAVGGLNGVVLLSLACGGLILWITARLVRTPGSWLLPAVLGLGTCLWFYAVAPWEHAPALALDMAAVLVASRRGRRSGLVSGVLLGLGASLRHESLLLLPGLILIAWTVRRSLGAALLQVAGTATVLLAAAGVDSLLYGRAVGAHMLLAVHGLRSVFAMLNVPMAQEVPGLPPMSFGTRYDTVVHYWLVGVGNQTTVIFFALATLAAAALWRWRKTSAGFLAIGVAALVWAASDAWVALQAPRWFAGLFRLSPFLVFALFPAPGLSEDERRWRRVMAIACGLFVLIAILTTDTNGGKSLGPRLLLPIVPLLVIVAWQSIVAFHRQACGNIVHRLVSLVGFALVAVSITLQIGVMVRAYAGLNASDRRAQNTVRMSGDTVLVVDDTFTAQLLGPLYFDKSLLLADTPALAQRLGEALDRARVPTFLLVSRSPRGEIAPTPFRLAASRTWGRLTVQRWVRDNARRQQVPPDM